MAGPLGAVFDAAPSPMDVEVWVEPFAGGLGAGLTALIAHDVPELWVCEAHPGLRAMWEEIIDDAAGFADLVEATVPTMALFDDCRDVVACPDGVGRRRLGFAAFLLNRCSRSGVVHPNAGPVGGRAQAGRDTITSRYNGPALADRIRLIGEYAHRIRMIGADGVAAIEELAGSGVEDEVFVFADPPYIGVGNRLYAEGFTAADHQRLADALLACPSPWLLTLDDHAEAHRLYGRATIREFRIGYSMAGARVQTELLITRPDLPVEEVVGERLVAPVGRR
jgi:DNA adenine methylase